jgi:hypothetical protein
VSKREEYLANAKECGRLAESSHNPRGGPLGSRWLSNGYAGPKMHPRPLRVLARERMSRLRLRSLRQYLWSGVAAPLPAKLRRWGRGFYLVPALPGCA